MSGRAIGAGAAEASAGLWLGIAELAELRGRDKATISRRVARFEAAGLLSTRKGPRGTKLVNVAEFDRATVGAGGAVRGLAEKSPAVAAEIAAHEHARHEAYAADLARLDLAERLGNLLPTDGVIRAATRCAGAFLAALADLPSGADEIAVAVGRDGPQGARVCLEALAVDVRRATERALADLAAAGAAAGKSRGPAA